MTSKEKYASVLDKICNRMLCGGECSVGEGKCELLETIEEAIIKAIKYDELTYQHTFEECIKEWNAKGFDVDIYALEIAIHNHNIEFTIDLKDKTLFMEGEYNSFPYDVVHLLSKTLKALEEMKDE